MRLTVDQAIAGIIEREGGYVDHPADRGGPTKYGITEATARAEGLTCVIRDLTLDQAADIYRRTYWVKPGFNDVHLLSSAIAAELFDTGVNMGPSVAIVFLQRALNVLNRQGRDYPDLRVDGRNGKGTIGALSTFLSLRGKPGEVVLLTALNALQGARYIDLAERSPSQEAFLYGWLANRVGFTL